MYICSIELNIITKVFVFIDELLKFKTFYLVDEFLKYRKQKYFLDFTNSSSFCYSKSKNLCEYYSLLESKHTIFF